MKYLKEVRSMLLTAVLVVAAMSILEAIIKPWLPVLLGLTGAITVLWMLYARATKL